MADAAAGDAKAVGVAAQPKRPDGATGTVPVAAATPEFDGTVVVLYDLHAQPDGFELQARIEGDGAVTRSLTRSKRGPRSHGGPRTTAATATSAAGAATAAGAAAKGSPASSASIRGSTARHGT